MAVPERACSRPGCGVLFTPKRADAKYHDEACRQRATRARAQERKAAGRDAQRAVEAAPGVAEVKARETEFKAAIGPLVEITRARLVKAGVEDSELAGSALALAYRIENGVHESGPALSAMIKAHREAVSAAVASSEETESAAVAARRSAQAKIFRLAAARAS